MRMGAQAAIADTGRIASRSQTLSFLRLTAIITTHRLRRQLC